MLKKLSVIILTIYSIMLLPNKPCVAHANSLGYARINNPTTYLYKSSRTDGSYSNIYCILEQSYFVELIYDIDNNFYEASYMGIVGFVRKSDVTKVVGTPNMPYPENITFEIKPNTKTYLRTSPQINQNNIMVALNSSQKLEYIGKVYGDEAMDFVGNTWYLARFNSSLGYVYAGYTHNLMPIYENVESLSTVSATNSILKINPLSNSATLLVITCIAVPAMFIILLMFYPKKTKVKKRKYKDKIDVTEYYNDKEL